MPVSLSTVHAHPAMASPTSIGIIPPICLCASIILCLLFFTFRATTPDGTSPRESTSNDNTSLRPEMMLDGTTSCPDYLAMRTHKDAQRKMTNIRNVFFYDERVYVGDEESSLLPGELYDDPLEQTTLAHSVSNKHGKDSINWHGTNTLNTSWGWMA
ncbi:hypothetical protein ACQKWADRAFT_302017 [Trichoderma austrokoningii]